MIINSLKTSLRHLNKSKRFTLLNIVGLSIGISACWMIFLIAQHAFSYDRNLADLDRTYKVVTKFARDTGESRMAGVSAPLYQGVRGELSGWEHVVPVFSTWVFTVEVTRPDGTRFTEEEPNTVVQTDQSYFEMLPYEWLYGDVSTAMRAPDQVVLTESRANLYFPGLDLSEIPGKTIHYYASDTLVYTVSGIVADYPQPSEFAATEFLTLADKVYRSNEWTNTNGSDKLYIQLNEGVEAGIFLAQLDALDNRMWKAFELERGTELLKKKNYELLPLKESHFATHISEYGVAKMSKTVLFGLMGIGVFLLLLACINYINMSVAQIPERAKEIGVRKTMGSSQLQLISQFLIETAVTGLLAAILAFGLTQLGFHFLQEIIPAGVTPHGHTLLFAGFVIAIILVITVCAGLYPAWLITRVKTIDVFKSTYALSNMKGRPGLQRVLIVFQFTMAIVFIISTIIVSSQLQHTLKAEMGFDKEAVVLIDIPYKYWAIEAEYAGKQHTVLREIRQLPGVQRASLATPPLSDGYSSSPYSRSSDQEEPQRIILHKKAIDTEYLALYDMTLVAGRNVSSDEQQSEYIINESAVYALGFESPEQAVGEFIHQLGNASRPVVGVVSDFHSQDFYTPITPLVMIAGNANHTTLNIKLETADPGQWQATLKNIQDTWASFYPAESFNYRFYDQTIEALYTSERQTAKLIHLATAITILISCLGLFGLATLAASRKAKEIGIRKVLGATVSGIVALLSRDFLRMVLIAIVIASPIAWFAMNRWLQDFAYRIEIQWWMFAVAGAAAVLLALITVSWQVLRVALANPVDSLRDE